MKKFEAHVAQDKIALSKKLVGEKLEAPVLLTPELLEVVAGGFLLEKTLPTTTTGALPPPDLLESLIRI